MYGYIYKITNLLNSKCYVGKHKYDKLELDESYITSGILINQSIQKNGLDNFNREIIDFADSLEELNKKEIYWIDKLNTKTPNGYNLTAGGDGRVGLDAWNKGLTQETDTRVYNNTTKSKATKYSKYGNYYGKQNVKLSEEHKKKISEQHKNNEKLKIQNKILHEKQKLLFKDSVWYHNDTEERCFKRDEEIPNGWIKGRLKNYFPDCSGISKSEETKKKISNSKKNTFWVNNGEKELMISITSEIPQGYIKGRLKNPFKKSMNNS